MTDLLLFLNLPCHMQVSFQARAKIFKTLTEVRKISWSIRVHGFTYRSHELSAATKSI